VSGPCFRKNIIDLNELVGEDELFVDGSNSTDDDVTNGTEIVDVVDGDSAVLSDLMDVVEPPSTESILEAWRNSVARQDDKFLRRGESKRTKQRHDKDYRDLKEIGQDIPKISTYFIPIGSSLYWRK